MSNLFNSGIRPAVDDYLLKQAAERRDYGNYWSASSAGYCMRKNIFERLQVPYVTEDARKQRVFTAGHVFHAWIQGITKDAGLSVVQEFELKDDTLMILGHIDDLVLVNDTLILYDFKTQNSRAFSYKRPQMSHYHKLQLGTYLYMLRKLLDEPVKPAVFDDLPELKEGRILKISKDDLRMSEEQLLWSESLSSDVRDYWTALNQAWGKLQATGELPPCSCADHEGGFMAREAYNPYFKHGEPCSEQYFKEWQAKETSNAGE